MCIRDSYSHLRKVYWFIFKGFLFAFKKKYIQGFFGIEIWSANYLDFYKSLFEFLNLF